MSSISGVSSNNAWMQAQMRTRPSGAQENKLAEDAFSKIDTGGKGSFDLAGLSTAVNNAQSANQSPNKTSFSSSDIQTAFSKLDSDGNGTVTKQEFTSTLSQLRGRHQHSENTSTQSTDAASERNGMNMQGMGGMQAMGGRPPPPPGGSPGGPPGDQGSDERTAEELKARLAEIGTADAKQSSFVTNVLNNFSKADSNGNGKVSFAEAIELNKSLSSDSSSISSTPATSASAQLADAASNSSSSTAEIQQNLMRQIMKVMQAYGADNLSQSASSSAGQLSVTA